MSQIQQYHAAAVERTGLADFGLDGFGLDGFGLDGFGLDGYLEGLTVLEQSLEVRDALGRAGFTVAAVG